MGQYLHPNRIAPRCLPCNYTDPAEGPPSNKTYVGFKAPRVSIQCRLQLCPVDTATIGVRCCARFSQWVESGLTGLKVWYVSWSLHMYACPMQCSLSNST